MPAVAEALRQGMDVNAQDDTGATAIQKACRYNRRPMVDYLIKSGADYRLADRKGLNALLLGCMYGQDDVIRTLVANQASLNAVDEKGLFPLLLAVDGDYGSTTELLIRSGADPNLANTNGTTALLYACEKGSKDALSALLELGADPNRANAEGWTPLMVAAHEGHGSLVDGLVRHGANLDMENGEGMTALLIAIECDQMELAHLLLENNAKWTVGEKYPYSAGISCYLGAGRLNGKRTAAEQSALYKSASHLFDVAAKECEATISNKTSNASGRNLRSALFVGASAVLLVATGGAPIPCALSNDQLNETIKNSRARLDRCMRMKAQCDDLAARLSLMPSNSCPDRLVVEDLTLTFSK